MTNQLNYSDISDVYLFLVKREKSGVNRTAEYKQVLASVGKAYGALKDEFLAEVPDNAVCIIADDLPNTHQYQFVRDLAERVRRDASKAYTYAGYRFKTVKDGCVSPAQAVFVYNRMPFTPRHTKGDSSDEVVDVLSHGTMACSCSILKKIKQEEPAGSNKNETRSVACSKLGIQIVCVVPSKDWSELPRTARPVEAVIRLSAVEHGVVFSYKEWRKPPVVSFARHTLYNTPVSVCNNSTVVKTTDLVAVIVTTHNRTETAKTTLKSLVEHLKYPNLYWIIADDRSDNGHVESLLAYMRELGVSDESMTCTKTTNEHCGLGASLNNALSVAFRMTDVILTTEDDWYLQFDFDISEYVRIIENDASVGTIRLGAANYLTKYLSEYSDARCLEVDLRKYTADRDKVGRANSLQVALRHRRMFDNVGMYVENKHPDIVESDMNRRFVENGNLKILWPSKFKTYALVCIENPFIHFGESTVGHTCETISIRSLDSIKNSKDEDNLFFGVVIPVYKSCGTLKRGLLSIARQTFHAYKVYVCDDESGEPYATTNMESVKSVLGDRGVFMRAGKKVYAGGARDKCIDAARCDKVKYMLFLDADDLFEYSSFFEDLHGFILSHNCPDVVVLPSYQEHRSINTLAKTKKCVDVKSFAGQRMLVPPWAKCIRADICPKFESGLRRANDVLQHMRLLDTAKTVTNFPKIAVRRKKDGETTLHGDAEITNKKEVGSITGLLKCATQILEEKYSNEYMRQVVADQARIIISKQLPELLTELGPALKNVICIDPDKNNLVTAVFGGRLGNVLLSMYTCFWYADKLGIQQSDVVFNKEYNTSEADGGIDDYLGLNADMFDNIKNNLLNPDDYARVLDEAPVTNIRPRTKRLSSATFDETSKRACVQPYVWHYPETREDRELFMRLFTSKKAIDSQLEKYGDVYDPENSVALHIRRTDYAYFEGGRYLESLYDIARRLEKHAGKTVVVFSDDIEWCKNNIYSESCRVLFHEPQDKPYKDLVLMSLFGAIDSNSASSYSYCAKLLNKNIEDIPSRSR